jgi:hypothetical protein
MHIQCMRDIQELETWGPVEWAFWASHRGNAPYGRAVARAPVVHDHHLLHSAPTNEAS